MTVLSPTRSEIAASISHGSAQAIGRAVALLAILIGLAYGAAELVGHQPNKVTAEADQQVIDWRGNSGHLPQAR